MRYQFPVWLCAALCCWQVTALGVQDVDALSGKPKLPRTLVRGESRLADDYLVRISGKAQVVDAHMLRLEDGTEVDLQGMLDAPELSQQGSIDNKMYSAGREAADFVEALIAGKEVLCLIPTDRPDWGEQMKFRQGHAFVGNVCINHELVRNGWAMAHHSAMAPLEAMAREQKLGLWRGKFVHPDRWRKGDRLPGEE